MTKNPFLNALCAIAYVSLMATFIFYVQRMSGPHQIDTLIIPVTLLSLLVLSTAVMAMIFFYQPIRTYLDGDKNAAVSLLVKTIGIFACITVLCVVLLLTIP